MDIKSITINESVDAQPDNLNIVTSAENCNKDSLPSAGKPPVKKKLNTEPNMSLPQSTDFSFFQYNVIEDALLLRLQDNLKTNTELFASLLHRSVENIKERLKKLNRLKKESAEKIFDAVAQHRENSPSFYAKITDTDLEIKLFYDNRYFLIDKRLMQYPFLEDLICKFANIIQDSMLSSESYANADQLDHLFQPFFTGRPKYLVKTSEYEFNEDETISSINDFIKQSEEVRKKLQILAQRVAVAKDDVNYKSLLQLFLHHSGEFNKEHYEAYLKQCQLVPGKPQPRKSLK